MKTGTFSWRRMALGTVAALAFAAMPALAQTTYTATVNQPIPDGSGSSTAGTPVVSTINVAGAPPQIQRIQVQLNITHTWVGDLRAVLTSPAGTSVNVLDRPGTSATSTFGCSGNNVNALFTDTAGQAAHTSCVPDPGSGLTTGPYNINPQSFSVFNGQNPNGTWMMTVTDNAGGDTGTFVSWALEDVIFIPVELVAFEATTVGQAVVLNWRTASETNNAGFEVEMRRGDSWTTLGFVNGHGTTTEAKDYSFRADNVGFGTHTFRLRQVDFDGAFEYSPEVEATIELAGTHHLGAAYPNPFNPQTRFELAVRTEQRVAVNVYDALGRNVATLFEGTLPANESRAFTFEASNLPSGIYLIRAVGEQFTQTQRVTLAK
jgi:subtilisin-like proprotein convertase family protein